MPRWRGGELDGLLNSGHAALHEHVAGLFEALPAWTAAPEVSFAIYGERGVIDVLAWHAERRALLVVELKTEIVDVQDLIGSVDRKRRLARRVGQERDWPADRVACWVAVAETRTNRRREAAHARVLRAAFPDGGRALRSWPLSPRDAIAALSFVTIANGGGTSRPVASRRRVRRPGLRSKAAREGSTGPANATGVRV